MKNNYKQFLANKETNSFWRKAKQIEFNKQNAIEKIFKYLTNDFSELTTRNSMTLRYLGLVINKGGNNLELSEAGQNFVRLPYKQKILDEQLMKVYLNSKELNPRIEINIIPLKVLLLLIKELEYITFLEYELFVCWINDYNEISEVISFIKDLRETNSSDEYLSVLNKKTSELNIGNFADNVKRFFDMLLISSYFVQNKETAEIKTMLKAEEIDIIINTFDDSNFSSDNYYEYLIHNDGWETYSDNNEIKEILKSLKQRTDEERKEIVKQVVKKEIIVTPIEEIEPEEIDLQITKTQEVKNRKITKKRTPIKIDFAKRDAENRESGDRAEKVVIKYEKEKLIKSSKNEFAEKVEQLSLKDDSLGYDILSFDINGNEKHIEVKGVRNKPNSKFSFYISDYEMEVACSDSSYSLYIVFDYLSKKPMIFKMPSHIFSGSFPGVKITPKKYLVEVSIDKLDFK